MEPILCLFCYNDISNLYKLTNIDEITQCPRCKALVTFTTDTSDVRYLFAEQICGTGCVGWNSALQIEVVTQPNIDTLYDSPDGEEIDRVSMAVGWDPNELLSVNDVARILGVSQEEISNILISGAFSSIFLGESQTSRLPSQEPQIPRRDVKAVIERGQQSQQASRA